MKILLAWLLMLSTAQAGTLSWDYDLTNGKVLPPTATVQRSQTLTGAFADLATIPSLPSTYVEPPVPAGWTAAYYRITNAGGISNVVGYTLPVAAPVGTVSLVGPMGPAGPMGPPGPQGLPGTPADMAQVQALELRVIKLEQRVTPAVSNLSTVVVNADQITITGLNCLSLKTSGTGLQRTITCVH